MIPDHKFLMKWAEIVAFERRLRVLQTASLIPGIVNASQSDAPLAVCLSQVMQPGDLLFVDHRSIAYAIALGMSLKDLWAELYGRNSSVGGGWSGSLHLVDHSHGLGGANGIVGAPLGWALGSALADRVFQNDQVSIAVVGDRVTETGIFYESLQISQRWSLPVLVVIRNNTHRSLDTIGKIGQLLGIPCHQESTTCLDQLSNTLQTCTERVRQGSAQLVEVHVSATDEGSPVTKIPWHESAMATLYDKARQRVEVSWGKAQLVPYRRVDDLPLRHAPRVSCDVAPKGSFQAVELSMSKAIEHALLECLDEDERVVVIGEDVGAPAEIRDDPIFGPYFQIAASLSEKFGSRLWSAPVSEMSWVLSAAGAASRGLRPVVDLMNVGFAACAFDAIANQAGSAWWFSRGKVHVPLVIRAIVGGGVQAGSQHSHMWHPIFCHLPGWNVVMPTSPEDAYGLLKAALYDNHPTMFLEHVGLYHLTGLVQVGHTGVMGRARIYQQGTELTVVAAGNMVPRTIDVVSGFPAGLVEIIDPVTLSPLDRRTILKSLQKTRRILVIDEAPSTGGWARSVVGELIPMAHIAWKEPPRVIAAPDCPVPFSPALEQEYIPTRERIGQTIGEMLGL